jgi:hypothetical protein
MSTISLKQPNSVIQSLALHNAEKIDLDQASPNPCFLNFAQDKIVIHLGRVSLKMHRCTSFAKKKLQ